jgi:serine/threonine-protein kinase
VPGETDFENQAGADTSPEIPSGTVLAGLDAVLSSTVFARVKRPARFLRHLVETALRGERNLLKESVIGTDVFEREPDWDPRLDPVVRQEAARLRKRLATYYETEGKDAAVVIELPVGSYVPVFRRRIVEEIPRPPELPVEPPRRPRTVWPYWLAAAIFCMVAGLLTWRALAPRDEATAIVVLPFTDLSADPSTQYFADGLTDEITDSLTRLRTLRVIARSSAFQFKGKPVDIRKVGQALHVSHVLEGSVARSGDRIRIIAHLERVSDASLVWSNTYESGTGDLFTLQAELAAGIAGSLNATSAAPAAKHVPNAAAHDLVMKARYDVEQMTSESLTRAESEYQRAMDLDPQYPAAYFGLGCVQYDRFVARGSTYQTEDERKSTEKWMRKALELDPDLAPAHAVLAGLTLQYDWNWTEAERELQAAVAGAPNDAAESYYAFFLVFRGRFSEAERHIQRMLDVDPFSTASLNNLAVQRNLEGRFAEAREAMERIAEHYPQMIPPQLLIGGTYIEEGHPEKALPIFSGLEPRFPQVKVFEAMAAASSGKRDEALRLIHPFEQDYANSGISMQWFAMVYALLGDEVDTIKWLNRSADRHEWQALGIGVNPVFARFRNAPGFLALKKRMGL